MPALEAGNSPLCLLAGKAAALIFLRFEFSGLFGPDPLKGKNNNNSDDLGQSWAFLWLQCSQLGFLPMVQSEDGKKLCT